MTSDIAAFTTGSIYLDTMVLYTFLRAETRIRPVVGDFFARIESGTITAYTSALTFDELSYRLLLALIRDHYPGSPLDILRDQQEAMLQEFAPRLVPQLELLARFPHLQVLDVVVADLEGMWQHMLDYALRPRDALHLAAMRRVGCLNLASNDPHFDAVLDLRRFVIG